MAAVLACDPGALLSHHWALWNHGLGPLPSRDPDVIAPSSRHDRDGLTLRRCRSREPDANHHPTTAESPRAEAPAARGVPTKALLAQLPPDQHGATRSLLEDLVFDLHRERGLPLPARNEIRHGIECDFAYPSMRLDIAADGFAHHGTRIAFENDHEVRLYLEAKGERVGLP